MTVTVIHILAVAVLASKDLCVTTNFEFAVLVGLKEVQMGTSVEAAIVEESNRDIKGNVIDLPFFGSCPSHSFFFFGFFLSTTALEADLMELAECFQDISKEISVQGQQLNTIEKNTEIAAMQVEQGTREVSKVKPNHMHHNYGILQPRQTKDKVKE